jgi:molybdopterin/thiamine biosynthesis adenylyltransferase
MLSDHQIERYSRQIILPEFGGRAQQTLLSATVAIVGSGTLGTTALTYLAAAGVGRVAVAAPGLRSEIQALNPDCQISLLPAPLTVGSAQEAVRHCDVVLTCSATPDGCALLNAACVAQHTPLVWADTAGAVGLITVLVGQRLESPCYTCAAPNLSRWLAGGTAAHVLAEATAALIGTLQATATIKILVGLGATPAARLLAYDAAAATVGEMTIDKDPSCTTCGARCA